MKGTGIYRNGHVGERRQRGTSEMKKRACRRSWGNTGEDTNVLDIVAETIYGRWADGKSRLFEETMRGIEARTFWNDDGRGLVVVVVLFSFGGNATGGMVHVH